MNSADSGKRLSILYAREWPINLPSGIYDYYNIEIANTVADAKRAIDSSSSIDAFVLGVVMVKDSCLKEASRLNDVKAEIIRRKYPEWDFFPTEAVNDEDKRSGSIERIDDQIKTFLDYEGGYKVFDYLLKKNIVGRKPVLFLTSQTGARNYLSNKGMEAFIMPVLTGAIEQWFQFLPQKIKQLNR